MFAKKKDTSAAQHSLPGLFQVDSLVSDTWIQTYQRLYNFLLIAHCACCFVFLGSALATGSTGLAA